MRKDEFLYTVTHELRTPLTSIRALSEILSDNPEIEEEEAPALSAHHHPRVGAPEPADNARFGSGKV